MERRLFFFGNLKKALLGGPGDLKIKKIKFYIYCKIVVKWECRVVGLGVINLYSYFEKYLCPRNNNKKVVTIIVFSIIVGVWDS